MIGTLHLNAISSRENLELVELLVHQVDGETRESVSR